MPWDPDRYRQFQAQRFAPFDDLVALVRVRPGLRVVDLGCGTGELTVRLADALPESDVAGIDSSAEMLARAAEHRSERVRFEQPRSRRSPANGTSSSRTRRSSGSRVTRR